jgi:hypothetical protein
MVDYLRFGWGDHAHKAIEQVVTDHAAYPPLRQFLKQNHQAIREHSRETDRAGISKLHYINPDFSRYYPTQENSIPKNFTSLSGSEKAKLALKTYLFDAQKNRVYPQVKAAMQAQPLTPALLYAQGEQNVYVALTQRWQTLVNQLTALMEAERKIIHVKQKIKDNKSALKNSVDHARQEKMQQQVNQSRDDVQHLLKTLTLKGASRKLTDLVKQTADWEISHYQMRHQKQKIYRDLYTKQRDKLTASIKQQCEHLETWQYIVKQLEKLRKTPNVSGQAVLSTTDLPRKLALSINKNYKIYYHHKQLHKDLTKQIVISTGRAFHLLADNRQPQHNSVIHNHKLLFDGLGKKSHAFLENYYPGHDPGYTRFLSVASQNIKRQSGLEAANADSVKTYLAAATQSSYLQNYRLLEKDLKARLKHKPALMAADSNIQASGKEAYKQTLSRAWLPIVTKQMVLAAESAHYYLTAAWQAAERNQWKHRD